ncbi:MAG TPA: VWA domain-containing protein [Thermoanaerobaculia bacterium]|nr:VWA domain-containing protein [Thermoanaerobaculia bacterium]
MKKAALAPLALILGMTACMGKDSGRSPATTPAEAPAPIAAAEVQPEPAPVPPPPPPASYPVATMKAARIAGVEGGVVGGVMGGVAGGTAGGRIGVTQSSNVAYRYAAAPAADDEHNTEEYGRFEENPFLRPADNPLSTFSIDVDRASYANVRRFLDTGQRPPRQAVRIEEMVNYFTYDYPDPAGGPFSITTELAACPWNNRHKLMLIGLQGKRMRTRDLPPNNLVFLIDSSGSMQSPDKLPLVKAGLRLLVDQLRPDDRVAIVTYAGSAGLVLPSTSGANKGAIMSAIEQLDAGGSTAGAEGIVLAYDVAKKNFLREGNNRVILATDGDFNVGVSSDGELEQLIERKRRDGVFLTVLGFGTGNIKDSKMELLADKGNGNYAYVDSLFEARKTLVHEMGATLFAIAKDVKIQVEFNPARVGAYRLLGYENRMLRSEDFNDDQKDAGELGAGHSVTSLYEIIPPGAEIPAGSVDPLKYQKPAASAAREGSNELATVKLRYKEPDGDTSKLLSRVVHDSPGVMMSDNFRLAASVAQLGMLLRDSPHKAAASYESVLELARSVRSDDPEGYRRDLLSMVAKAERLPSPKEVAEK